MPLDIVQNILAIAGLLSFPALVGSILAFLIGLRGRRVDENPLCRSCGFDLLGLHGVAASREAVPCPECGRDVSKPRAVRIGNRVARPAAVTTGVSLACLALLGAGSVAVVASRGAAWQRVAPTWLLRLQAESATTSLKRSALTELAQRVLDGNATATTAIRLADRVLEIQADPDREWLVEHGDLVEAVWHAGHLNPPRYRRFLEQGVRVACEAAVDPRGGLSPDPRMTDATPVLRARITRVGASTAVGIRARIVSIRYDGMTFEGDGLETETVTLGPGSHDITAQSVLFDRGRDHRAAARFFIEIRGTDRDDDDSAGLAAIRFEESYEYDVLPTDPREPLTPSGSTGSVS